MITDRLLDEHSVAVDTLAAEAVSASQFRDGSTHLFQFFENPTGWREHAERLDDLCARVDGLFSKRDAEGAVAAAGPTTFLEFSEAIHPWM